MKNYEILGIDIGHTIYDNPNKRPFPHAFRVIRRLVDERFGLENVHIVSRVTPEQEVRAREFISTGEFKMAVRIPLEQVHFCRERPEKARICVRLGVTHFIDDRPGVLVHMPFGIQRIVFNPTECDLREFALEIATMVHVNTWVEIERVLLPA